MKIDTIQIENFRGIKCLELVLDPRFTLLVGDNGSGKTSILSAVSVALGIWNVSGIVRGAKQWRNIVDHEIREILGQDENGERQFIAAGPVQITATGSIGGRVAQSWTRRKRARKAKTVDQWSEKIEADIVAAVAAREQKLEALPLLAYYGAGRAWLPSNEREQADLTGDLKSRPEDGYYDCLNERIRIKDMLKWFVLQAAKRDEKGQFKPAFEAVRLAMKRGIPGVDEIYWDHTKGEVVVSIHGKAQPFTNLSDGQRTMASTLADMAIRAVALNAHLLGSGNGGVHPEWVLDQTPGVVLIDEVDVHLHPEWQRSVVRDLLSTFPKVQFICTSHSAQVMGEVPAMMEQGQVGQVWILGPEGPRKPAVNYADSNWNLEHQMGPEVEARNSRVRALLSKAQFAMMNQELGVAETALATARDLMGGEDGQLTRLTSSLATLKKLADANH
jgi:predicted ATP-binding protein involved in virulence